MSLTAPILPRRVYRASPTIFQCFIGAMASKFWSSCKAAILSSVCFGLSARTPPHPNSSPIATDTLEALAQTAKEDQENVPQDKKSQARLLQYATEGSEDQAKHAVIVLTRMNDKEKICKGLLAVSNRISAFEMRP